MTIDPQQGERGERGARGARGKSSWAEWIRWGITIAALAWTWHNASDIRENSNQIQANAMRADKQAAEARKEIVRTGRAAIGSGCVFDNVRQNELRVGLKLFLDDHRALHRMAERFNVPIDHRNLHRINKGIKGLTVRDCDHARQILRD